MKLAPIVVFSFVIFFQLLYARIHPIENQQGTDNKLVGKTAFSN